MSVLIVAKPAILFDKEGNIRSYGVHDESTVFSLGVISIALAILCYYLFALIDCIFG